jgi:hypothetical protein
MVGKPRYEAVQGECKGSKPVDAYLYSVIQLTQAGRFLSSYDMHIITRFHLSQ